MTLGTPRIPFVSNVTGTWMTNADAKDPAYWARHLRQTTRFAEGLATLLAEPDLVLLEVGPGKTLETLSLMHPHAGRAQLITTTMPAQGSSRTGLEALLGAVARLWCAGVDVDWAAFSKDEQRQRVPLPTYPFDRTVYQMEAHTRSEAPLSRMMAAPKPRQEESRPAAARPGAEPGTVEGILAGIWCEQLGVEAVRPSDNFFDLGGNSLMAVHFRAQIQERLQVDLTVHALLEHPTFSALLERVQQQVHEAARTPAKALAAGEGPSAPTVLERPRLLIPLQEGAPEKAPLFLVQPIGGTVFTYMALARALGADQPVYGLRASGMEPGEPVYSDVPTIAARYVEELRSLQPKGPYVLGGHSSGGVIAYEMALQLLEQGEDVPMIVMIDTVSVEQSRRLGITRPEDVLRLVEGFKTSAPQTYQMFVTALAENSTFREIVLQTNRALASYEPRACRTQILYVRARERDTVLDAHPETSWLELSEGLFTAHNAPGNHFTVMETPHVAAVARIVRQVLDALPVPEQRVAPLGSGGNPPRCSVAALGAGH